MEKWKAMYMNKQHTKNEIGKNMVAVYKLLRNLLVVNNRAKFSKI